MEFEPNEDRRLFTETLTRYLAEQYPLEHRTAVAYETPFHDPEKWRELTDLGVLHALVPEEAGSIGGTGHDITMVFEPLGRALCPEPVLPALLSVTALTAAGADVSAALTGDITYALAIGEPDAPYGLDALTTTATPTAAGWALTGRKSVIYGGHIADRILVAARTDSHLSLFQIDPADADITSYGLIDGGGAAELFLDATPAERLLANANNALTDALDKGALALCAEAVGAMQTCHEMLLNYLKTRQQFGRPIGSFQALQHRMVDLTTELEQARSITILAASRIGTPLQSRTVSMAKSLVGRAARHMAEETIQMHGGIAMTWDYAASHYAKRLVMIDHQLGDSDYHLAKVMEGY